MKNTDHVVIRCGDSCSPEQEAINDAGLAASFRQTEDAINEEKAAALANKLAEYDAIFRIGYRSLPFGRASMLYHDAKWCDLRKLK